MSREKEKIEFIQAWYDLEKDKLSTTHRLELLKRWIESCVSFEEYEMAAVLRMERGLVMKIRRMETHGKRGIIKSIKIWIRYRLRKL
jgi:protein-arginine kinase activator protein McsA